VETWRSLDYYTNASRVWAHDLALSKYHFVPIHQYKTGVPSYRDKSLRGNSHRVLATMSELVDSSFIAISWTQRFLPEPPPASWIMSLFDFVPTYSQVAAHLAPTCRLTEREFFNDLQATYVYLSNPTRVQAAGISLRQSRGQPIWLNIDLPLENTERLRVNRNLISGENENTVNSLLWLSAKQLVEGIEYDALECDLYRIRQSLQPYQNLVHISGINAVQKVPAYVSPDPSESHGDAVLQSLYEMRNSESSCDMTIILRGFETCAFLGRSPHFLFLLASAASVEVN
jgi:hypothetical protein